MEASIESICGKLAHVKSEDERKRLKSELTILRKKEWAVKQETFKGILEINKFNHQARRDSWDW